MEKSWSRTGDVLVRRNCTVSEENVMKIQYIGEYAGVVPWCNLAFIPLEIREVDEATGRELVKTGQFKEIEGGEIP